MSNLVQSFYVDSASVQGATSVFISKVDLYFFTKPQITGNKSGIYAPGAQIAICEVTGGLPTGVPISSSGTQYQPIYARKEYAEINSSSDSSLATTFHFDTLVPISTNTYYAIMIMFDGNEDFQLWEAKQGDFLIGTTAVCSGPSGKYVGQLYDYISTTTSTGANTPGSYVNSSLSVLNNQDLKFNVYCARFATNGVPYYNANASSSYTTVSGNSIVYVCPTHPIELFSFNKQYSASSNVSFGDYVYQKQSLYPPNSFTPATCGIDGTTTLVTLNPYTYANSVTAGWSDLFLGKSTGEYIVIKSLNHYGVGLHATAVRQVLFVGSNTSLIIDEPIPFINTTANFFKSPVGKVSATSTSYIYGKYTNLLVVSDSNANSSNRFVNDSIISTIINVGGTGFSNTDTVIVSGFESVPGEVTGGYNATIILSTNSTGGIVNTQVANAGCGFVNGYNYVIKANTGANSTGSGANLSFNIGSTLMTNLGQESVFFSNTKVINMPISQITPDVIINFNSGTNYNITLNTPYYSVPSSNTVSGVDFFISPTGFTETIDLKNEYTTIFATSNTPIITSRSNQFVIGYANGSAANLATIGFPHSNVATYQISTTSNNDFSAASIQPQEINSFYSKYSINDDYTNENTNYGNAWAKHISTKVSFDTDQRAEDLVVYVTAYRPLGTRIKVYARIFNSQDSDTFDIKDWTLLQRTSGEGVFSNPANTSDINEYTYQFQAFPNSDFTSTGTVSANLNSNIIVGAGTNFTANLAVNDLVKIYSPLFPNTNYIVAVVNSIANATYMTLSQPISNVSITGAGLALDRIRTYNHQAFNNITNDNVVRYYDTNMVEHDTFDTAQLKIVMLSNNQNIVPRISDVRFIGVSA